MAEVRHSAFLFSLSLSLLSAPLSALIPLSPVSPTLPPPTHPPTPTPGSTPGVFWLSGGGLAEAWERLLSGCCRTNGEWDFLGGVLCG